MKAGRSTPAFHYLLSIATARAAAKSTCRTGAPERPKLVSLGDFCGEEKSFSRPQARRIILARRTISTTRRRGRAAGYEKPRSCRRAYRFPAWHGETRKLLSTTASSELARASVASVFS